MSLRMANSNREDYKSDNTDDGFDDTDNTEKDSSNIAYINPSSAGFPNLPPWASACKPCPNGTFSLGGTIRTAKCQLCDDGFTSLPASAECTSRSSVSCYLYVP